LTVVIIICNTIRCSSPKPITITITETRTTTATQHKSVVRLSNAEKVLGNNVKNLVKLIPNEAHEDTSQIKETRLLNQTYLPENALVNVGTTITWLNTDAGHRHSLTLVDDNTKNIVYDSGRFDNSSALIMQVHLLIQDQALIEHFLIIK
jgi:plastocyanin